jgi:hypothetical protein
MKMCSHLWQCLAEFLEWEMFQIKVVEKIKTHILCAVTFFRKLYHLWEYRKLLWSQRGCRQYGTCTWSTGEVSLHMRKHTPVLVHPHPQPPPPHTHTCIHTHNTYFFPWPQWFCKCTSVLRYMYSACLCFFQFPFIVFDSRGENVLVLNMLRYLIPREVNKRISSIQECVKRESDL